MKYLIILIVIVFNVIAQENKASRSADNAHVYIISPSNGESVSEDVIVKFGLDGMGIAPAGYKIEFTGHHHLIVDGEVPNLDKVLGSDVIHFGLGQMQTQLKLSKGKHTLQLVLGDFKHMPHTKPLISEKITIWVTKH